MKYLKRINELCINESIHEEIDDILLDIRDLEFFTASIWGGRNKPTVFIKLKDWVGDDTYMSECYPIEHEIKECVRRLLSFMGGEGYKYKFYFGTEAIPPGSNPSEFIKKNGTN